MVDHTYNPDDCKQCRICGEVKLCSEFFRSAAHMKGCRNECKQCKSLVAGYRRRTVLEPAPEGMKRCGSCKNVYPESRAYFVWSSTRGLRNICKGCKAEYVKKYREKPEFREWYSAYYSSQEYKEQDKERKSTAHYKERDRPNAIIRGAKRAARRRNLPDIFTSQDWALALDYFGNSCAVCSRPAGLWHTLAQDHWIPLTSPDCPGTVPTNIVPLCHGIGGCNNSKHAHDPHVWLTQKFGKRKAKQIAKRIQDYFQTLK